jgi:hypothetical protein
VARSWFGKRAGGGRGRSVLLGKTVGNEDELERRKVRWDGEKEEWDAWVAGSDEEGETVCDVLKGDGKDNVCPSQGCGDGCFGKVDDNEDLDDSIVEETSCDCCGEGVARICVDGNDEVEDDEGQQFAGRWR